MTWICLALAIIGNSTANILMKLGAKQIGGFSFSLDGIKAFLSSTIIWAGLICFGFALFFYTYVLSKLNLSVAYPLITSLGFVIVTFFSIFYFHEVITWVQIAGMVLVVLGLYMIVGFAK